MIRRSLARRLRAGTSLPALVVALAIRPLTAQANDGVRCPTTDSHLHLTNYVQRGPDLHALLTVVGDSLRHAAVFGIPLQQQWSHAVSGNAAPTYYLQSDAPLYYYSFTDAYIAMQYRSLSAAERERVDPMITGFNPADMYAADHIRRVLRTFPGVFTGIGEFTVHKEFVSDKVRPGPPSLLDPALDSVLHVAEEVGLLVIMHNDIDVPFPSDTAHPAYLDQMKEVVRGHPGATIVWAHTGVGRVVRPVKHHLAMLEAMLGDPTLANLYFDLSWDEVAKYIVASEASIAATASLVNRFPDRFLFGTDVVAPANERQYYRLCDLYRPFLERLTPTARAQLGHGNYERLFGAARRRVRAWEAHQVRADGDRRTSTNRR